MNLLETLATALTPLRSVAPSAPIEAVKNRARVPWRRSFKGAEISRLTGDWIPSRSTPDEEVRRDAKLLRQRTRELARNSAIARNYLSLLSVSVIGHVGFKHQSQVRNNPKSSTEPGELNTRINDELERGFADWSKAVSLDGRMSLTQFQSQAIQAVARDGEVFIRKWRSTTGHGLALEAIDADLIDELYNVPAGKDVNEVRMGIEVDRLGRRVAYHVWNRPTSLFAPASDRKRERIPATDMLHLYDPERVNQTRGVSWFACVMMLLHAIEGYIEAELTAARVGAAKMGWFVRQENESGAVSPESEDGVLTTDATPGSFEFAPDGYEVQAWNVDHPNSNFGDFMRSLLRQVAVGLRVSYNALVSDLESVNYSSMRSGMLIEREVWRQLQQWWIHDFLEPVYREWLTQSVLTGEVSVDTREFKKLLKSEFTPRGWDWVDPLKDTNASIAAINAGLETHTDVLASQGRSFEDLLAKKKAEQALAKQYGVEINAQPKPAPGEEKEPGEKDDEEEKPEGEQDDAPAAESKNGSGRSRFAHVEVR